MLSHSSLTQFNSIMSVFLWLWQRINDPSSSPLVKFKYESFSKKFFKKELKTYSCWTFSLEDHKPFRTLNEDSAQLQSITNSSSGATLNEMYFFGILSSLW